MIVLGIETSCDETAAAVVAGGRRILSSVVSSQVAVHRPFGGVVPELASRKHIEAIVPVVRQALSEAGISQAGLEAVAVTQGPGLIGSLLVGFSFAKAFAMVRGLPWIGVSHLEGHINSVFLEPNPPAFPFTTLLASGGHTSIYHVTSHTQFDLMGQTRDDAAGEAFDKVARLLGLPYPGGPHVARLALRGTPGRFTFPRPMVNRPGLDFSFSGLKTHTLNTVAECTVAVEIIEQDRCDIALAFEEAVVATLVIKCRRALRQEHLKTLVIAGGVSANTNLRQQLSRALAKEGARVFYPAPRFCTDNGAMIAYAGWCHLQAGRRDGLDLDSFARRGLTSWR